MEFLHPAISISAVAFRRATKVILPLAASRPSRYRTVPGTHSDGRRKVATELVNGPGLPACCVGGAMSASWNAQSKIHASWSEQRARKFFTRR